jgi:hypothetical protein
MAAGYGESLVAGQPFRTTSSDFAGQWSFVDICSVGDEGNACVAQQLLTPRRS